MSRRKSLSASREEDIHIWCEHEHPFQQTCYTISVGKRVLCRALVKGAALQILGNYLDELAQEDRP
jgi:hypothetical protein